MVQKEIVNYFSFFFLGWTKGQSPKLNNTVNLFRGKYKMHQSLKHYITTTKSLVKTKRSILFWNFKFTFFLILFYFLYLSYHYFLKITPIFLFFFSKVNLLSIYIYLSIILKFTISNIWIFYMPALFHKIYNSIYDRVNLVLPSFSSRP